jgi:hypothetical protein
MRVWRLGKRLLKGPPSNPIGKLGVLGVKPKRLRLYPKTARLSNMWAQAN